MKQCNEYDLVVVGGGHAGIEAAMIASKLGASVALVTIDKKALGRMSCNPAIGGLAKGQMVREIDILGGVMAQAADFSGLQFKLLNRSKGRAVWSPRAQVDKRKYEKFIYNTVHDNHLIKIIEAEAINLSLKSNRIAGIILRDNSIITCRAIILTCGTFLNGLIHIGDRKIPAGRMGEKNTGGITEALKNLCFNAGRLKTGTPPRLVRSSINWAKTTAIFGDSIPTHFSHFKNHFNSPNIPCYTIRTNNRCHEIIRTNFNRSPMFSGDIHGTGPRYCPSIEDKIHRFSQRSAHSLFLEPEWAGSEQIYANGFSTSLPEQVQLRALQELPGLNTVEFLRPGYAIEYDFFPPAQLKSSLESKSIAGLFLAGQINGTSGYEEAAAQGLIAGINSFSYLKEIAPLILKRSDAYIGVLIDDLITKDTMEPYRMFTSRAEYRLLLRYSNADDRLVAYAEKFNLLSTQEINNIRKKLSYRDSLISVLSNTVEPDEINNRLVSRSEDMLTKKQRADVILKRPHISIKDLPVRLFKNIPKNNLTPLNKREAFFEAETTIKYVGYIARHNNQIQRLIKHEKELIPFDFDYFSIKGLSAESKDKFNFVRPETLGQAGRISGVSPADLSILSIWVFKHAATNIN